MKPHLFYAQQYWKEHVLPGDTVIDATVGNGYDTFFLTQLLQGNGKMIGYDIQAEAIAQTKKRLEGLPDRLTKIVFLKLQSHICFDEKNIKLIVYNLGYLPGGNKSVTTQCATTLKSIQSGLEALCPCGAMSITCYPGHEEGAKEQLAIMEFLNTLTDSHWRICHHVWFKSPLSPSLIWLKSGLDA